MNKRSVAVQVRHKSLSFLQDAVQTLDRLVNENPDDIGGLVRADAILGLVTEDIKTLRGQINHLTVQALEAQPDRKFEDNELGEIAITANPTRKFDDDKVTSLLVIAAERAAQKAEEHGDNVARAIVKAVRSVMTASKPKVTALKAFNVEPDDISTTEWGQRSFKITPNDPALPLPKAITKGTQK